MTSSPIERGRSVIAAFLYQVVGVIGMQASGQQAGDGAKPTHGPGFTGSDLEYLLTLVPDGTFYHERFEDAMLESVGLRKTDECVLIQFKYSSQSPPADLTPGELEDIVDRLILSERQARNAGLRVTGYALITNRELGSGAQELVDAATQGNPLPRLDSDGAAERRQILKVLRRVLRTSFSDWEHQIEAFAHSFGAQPDEIHAGIATLTYDLLSSTSLEPATRLTTRHLVKAFTGSDDAEPLRPAHAAGPSLSLLRRSHLRPDHDLVLRENLLKDIRDLMAQHAIILVCGPGGCGKSAMLWQWTEHRVRREPPDAQVFTCCDKATRIPVTWVAWTVAEWGHLPRVHPWRSQAHQRAFDRLCTANDDATAPLLVMGLDGAEDDLSDRDHARAVQDIIDWFWDEHDPEVRGARPPARVLILTCRDPEELEKWFGKASRIGNRVSGLECVRVDDFELSELQAAALRTGNSDLYTRIGAAEPVPSSNVLAVGPALYEDPFTEIAGATPARVDARIFRALHHPAMWGCLLSLLPDEQLKALDGKEEGIDRLAHAFVDRVCRAAVDRGRDGNLGRDKLIGAFPLVAAATEADRRYQRSTWLDAMQEDHDVSRTAADRLYREAISGGLIERMDGDSWRWHHAFVHDFLTGRL